MNQQLSPTRVLPPFATIFLLVAVSTVMLSWDPQPCSSAESQSAPAKPASEATPSNLPLVILLGDSIRINYQGIVRSELEGKAKVWSPKDNCAHSLYTLQNLEKWLKGQNPAVVHINVGLHDLFLNEKTGLPRHSLELYSENLRKIFARLKELTDAKIIFALTTPVDEERQASSKTYKRVVRHNSDIVRYNQQAAKIAKECGAAVDDVHAVAMEAGIDNVICDDGVHLTEKGKQVVGKQVARCVLSVLGDSR